MLNQLDTYAPADATDAEESAYENAARTIAKLDGRALFESGILAMDGTDGMFDCLDLPRIFDASLAGDTWDDMAPDEHTRWDALAAVIRAFALDRLDEEKAAEHAEFLAA